jgi:hypothetical protein
MTQCRSYEDFFENPVSAKHRLYEVLRARFVEHKSVPAIASQFGLTFYSAQSMIRDFKLAFDQGDPLDFFITSSPGPKIDRKKSQVREHIIRLRAKGYASTDIFKALQKAGLTVSLSLIDQVLREEGLTGLKKRNQNERTRIFQEIMSGQIPGLTIPKIASPQIPAVADVRLLNLESGQTLQTPYAGAFLFLPFLAKVGINSIVNESHLVGTKMIPAVNYLLSTLILKFLDKERKSHIADWNCDEALGLAAGLNILPKTTAITDYSYRLVQKQHSELLGAWVKAVYPILCPEGATSFSIDFHTIPHRGEDTGLEKHYVPMRGKATSSVLTCFARAIDAPLLCYAEADILHSEKEHLVSRFVNYWKTVTGFKPAWLYFDSKMTTYNQLDKLNSKDPNERINFITIRRRGSALVKRIQQIPSEEWKHAVIDIPKRRYKAIRYLDQRVKLINYEGECRQLVVDGLGRSTPTFLITNNEELSGRDIFLRYIQRNWIENDLGINVDFFHMDCLASDVRLNVAFDMVNTVIANGCYRWLSQQLKGCEKMEPKQLYRKFVQTAGTVTISGDEIVVTFERRSHNPIIAQAKLDQEQKPIPWLDNKKIRFLFS